MLLMVCLVTGRVATLLPLTVPRLGPVFGDGFHNALHVGCTRRFKDSNLKLRILTVSTNAIRTPCLSIGALLH